VTAQTTVEESQLAPAVKGHWIICGGFPEIAIWEFAETVPKVRLTVATILTIAKVLELYQISAGSVKVRLPNGIVNVAATWYVG